MEELVDACVRGGVDRIQLRDRSLEGGEWLAFADAVGTRAQAALAAHPSIGVAGDPPRMQVIVNRRVDVALTTGAEGVHLGFDAMAIADARSLLGASARIGVSTHTAEEAVAATESGADYVHLAPIYTPLSKPATRPPLGPTAVARAARGGARVIAQGGIEAGNVAQIIRAGAVGVAVTGAILAAGDPGEAAAALRTALDTATHD